MRRGRLDLRGAPRRAKRAKPKILPLAELQQRVQEEIYLIQRRLYRMEINQ